MPRAAPLSSLPPTVTLANRGHHFAEAAAELKQDDGLTRRVGAGGAALVANILAPHVVQVGAQQWVKVAHGWPAMDLPQAPANQHLTCLAAATMSPQPCARLAVQAYWQLLLFEYRKLQVGDRGFAIHCRHQHWQQ